jgi:hypothetical protein
MINDVILNLIEKAMSIYLYNSQSSYAMTPIELNSCGECLVFIIPNAIIYLCGEGI